MSLWLTLFSCASPPAAQPAPRSPPPSPAPQPGGALYAVGDLHGDLDNTIATLKLASLVDDGGHWTGGDATLVQTGDTTDRGPESRQILALLRGLQSEASAAGGRVVALLGNHEVMNLRGDWRYVDPGDLAAYGGEEARRAAFSPEGEDGRWLRSLPAVARVGQTVFVHGGVHPDFAAGGIDALNARVAAAIDAPAEDPAIGEGGPLWYRGYVQDPPETACPLLDRALSALSAERMVVGHTTRRDGHIEPRCGGKLLVIDIGISDAYGGHLGLVEIREGADAWSVSAAERADLPDPAGP